MSPSLNPLPKCKFSRDFKDFKSFDEFQKRRSIRSKCLIDRVYQVWVLVRLRTEVLYYFNSFRIEFLIVCIINRPWTSGVLMPSPHFSRSSKTTTGIRIWKRDWLFPIEGLFQFYFKVRVDYRRLSKENKNLGHYNYFRFGWRLEMDITFEDAQFYAVLVVSIVSSKNGLIHVGDG